jgi:hypothetical protein
MQKKITAISRHLFERVISLGSNEFHKSIHFFIYNHEKMNNKILHPQFVTTPPIVDNEFIEVYNPSHEDLVLLNPFNYDALI